MIHGRMFVSAWDCGLDAVDDDAVQLVLIAVEVWKTIQDCFRPV